RLLINASVTPPDLPAYLPTKPALSATFSETPPKPSRDLGPTPHVSHYYTQRLSRPTRSVSPPHFPFPFIP
uniref:Uncharacterized protein n=1 Tax=Aegilops tauschii subsp. strangulata TaxID=200361 RepID=A0A453NK55_AEGTS